MTTERPYRSGLTTDQAIAQLEEKAGTQFAAEIVEVMVRALREGRIRVLKSEASWSNSANAASPGS
jgi:HD-GYP domain-containing protein (c-di-GMP phosphodiesterase class II)